MRPTLQFKQQPTIDCHWHGNHQINSNLETRFYRNKIIEMHERILLPHFLTHVDSKYERSPTKKNVRPWKRLSSTQDFFWQKCKNRKPKLSMKISINVLQLSYQPLPTLSPGKLQTPSDSPVRITLPFKDYKLANVYHRELRDLERILSTSYS